MIKKINILFALLPVIFFFSACSPASDISGPDNYLGAPRLIVEGKVSNTSGEALPGIYVSIYGVREANEKDILFYNYAVTDTAGQYTIIRYRGREQPAEVTVVATDSTGIYQEQTIFAPVVYRKEWSYITNSEVPYDGIVTADFVLGQ